MPTPLWPSSTLLTVVDSGLRTHLVCLPHCPWTLSHADWSLLLTVVDSPSAPPFANCLSGFSQTCISNPTSGLVGDLESKLFVWFHAKTDKGAVCLADHLHSVTIWDNILFLIVIFPFFQIVIILYLHYIQRYDTLLFIQMWWGGVLVV